MAAREAMLGCFVSIHGESLKRGAQLMGKDITVEEAERLLESQRKGCWAKIGMHRLRRISRM